MVGCKGCGGRGVLPAPGSLVSLAARGFAWLSEARLKPLGFGVWLLPVLVALCDGTTRRVPDPEDGRGSRIALTKSAEARLLEAIVVLMRGNRKALRKFMEEEIGMFAQMDWGFGEGGRDALAAMK